MKEIIDQIVSSVITIICIIYILQLIYSHIKGD